MLRILDSRSGMLTHNEGLNGEIHEHHLWWKIYELSMPTYLMSKGSLKTSTGENSVSPEAQPSR